MGEAGRGSGLRTHDRSDPRLHGSRRRQSHDATIGPIRSMLTLSGFGFWRKACRVTPTFGIIGRAGIFSKQFAQVIASNWRASSDRLASAQTVTSHAAAFWNYAKLIIIIIRKGSSRGGGGSGADRNGIKRD